MFPILLALAEPAADVTIDGDNLVIERSCKIKPGKYVVADSDDTGVIQVEADNVTIDFQGATLTSVEDPTTAERESFTGVGVSINGHKNVTIKNANIHGFRYNILALQAEKVKLEKCNVSFSRAQRVGKNGKPLEHWLPLREVAAWREFGAGIWLESTIGCTVTECFGTGAQNGLVLLDSKDATAHNNDFSFNSGWGIALWKSSANTISWNRADFVNRPWGGGWGGDSAAIAVVNGSNENYFVGNSMTHSGDGFFLTDLVNGGFDDKTKSFKFEGSSNGNVVGYNDGSWSTANAFEGTFSFQNIYYKNEANFSNYGFWLGFSNDTTILHNKIEHNLVDGIAIEQGRGNWIQGNTLTGNTNVAVHLWSGTKPEHAQVPSRDLVVAQNKIRDSKWAFALENSTNYYIGGNERLNAPVPPGITEQPKGTLQSFHQGFEGTPKHKKLEQIYKRRPRGFKFYAETDMPKGVEWLQPSDYAPRDFRTDLVAVRRVNDYSLSLYPLSRVELKFDHPEWISVTQASKPGGAILIEARADSAGRIAPASFKITAGGRTQQIDDQLISTNWSVRWYQWNKDAVDWTQLFASTPKVTQVQREIAGDFSFRDPAPGINHQYFAFEATTELTLEAGKYEISSLSDDGIQVFVDEKPIIDAWKATPGNLSGEFESPGRTHKVRVRFMQTWGHSYLKLRFGRST